MNDAIKSKCVSLAAVLCFCLPAYGQLVTIQGKVVDQTGAPVPNARVLLIDLLTLEIQRTSSDSNGVFAFNGLERSPYEVKAASPGFVTGSAKVLELVDKVAVISANPPPPMTLKVKITLTVRSMT
jgi:hypothetical protein